MPDIRAVTLDLWQTLIIDKPEQGRERRRFRIQGTLEALHEAGEGVTEEQVSDAYRACYRTCQAIRQEGRDVSFNEQVQIFVRAIDSGLSDRLDQETFARILNRYADSFFHAPPKPADGVPEMLATLKERGYLLGLISNTGMTPGRLFRTYLEELGIIHLFDQLTFSDEVLLAKPSPAIFLTTLSALGATPEQGVHVGDHLRNDIAGAHEAGIRSVWLEGFDESEMVVKPTATIQRIADLPLALDRLS